MEAVRFIMAAGTPPSVSLHSRARARARACRGTCPSEKLATTGRRGAPRPALMTPWSQTVSRRTVFIEGRMQRGGLTVHCIAILAGVMKHRRRCLGPAPEPHRRCQPQAPYCISPGSRALPGSSFRENEPRGRGSLRQRWLIGV